MYQFEQRHRNKARFLRTNSTDFYSIELFVSFFSAKVLYIDMNAFKSYEFDVMIYHTANFHHDSVIISRIHVQSIMFLFKMSIFAKTRYWSTKFEVATLVWMIKKIRHMIETIIKTTVIITDYSVNTSIARQISLFFNNIDKLNLKLVKVILYLSLFDLNVRYKFKKNQHCF